MTASQIKPSYQCQCRKQMKVKVVIWWNHAKNKWNRSNFQIRIQNVFTLGHQLFSTKPKKRGKYFLKNYIYFSAQMFSFCTDTDNELADVSRLFWKLIDSDNFSPFQEKLKTYFHISNVNWPDQMLILLLCRTVIFVGHIFYPIWNF